MFYRSRTFSFCLFKKGKEKKTKSLSFFFLSSFVMLLPRNFIWTGEYAAENFIRCHRPSSHLISVSFLLFFLRNGGRLKGAFIFYHCLCFIYCFTYIQFITFFRFLLFRFSFCWSTWFYFCLFWFYFITIIILFSLQSSRRWNTFEIGQLNNT